MFGFVEVQWTDHELAAFVKKHDLFHMSANGATNWKRRGAMDYTHAVVIYDNAAMTRKIWLNAEVAMAEEQEKAPKSTRPPEAEGLCGYIAFYRGERHEVYAENTLAAQVKAQVHFQKKHPRRKVKTYECDVMIAERADGSAVVHSTASLG